MWYYYLLQQDPCCMNLLIILLKSIIIIIIIIIVMTTNHSLHRPVIGPEVCKSLRLPDFQTVLTWWQGCQSYVPAAFTRQEIFLVLISRGIESRWGRVFPHSSRAALGPTQPPIQSVSSLSEGVKWPGRGVNHPPHLVPRLKKEKRYTSIPPLGFRGLL